MSSQVSSITKVENQTGNQVDADDPPQAVYILKSLFCLLHIAQYKHMSCISLAFM